MKKDEIVNELFKSANENGLTTTIGEIFGPCVKVKIEFSKKDCETGIDELEFSVRANNALKRAGLFTVGEIVDIISSGELGHIRNLGKKTENEIKTRLLQLGYDSLTDNEKKSFFYYILEHNHKKLL